MSKKTSTDRCVLNPGDVTKAQLRARLDEMEIAYDCCPCNHIDNCYFCYDYQPHRKEVLETMLATFNTKGKGK